jgi:non-canonical (house-cleaning) NTP pyrophosphatase
LQLTKGRMPREEQARHSVTMALIGYENEQLDF